MKRILTLLTTLLLAALHVAVLSKQCKLGTPS